MVRILQIMLAVVLGALILAVYRAHLWWIVGFGLTHLMFPVLLAVIFGIVYGLIGADYGLPSLYWHDKLRTRLGAAMATTMLLVLIGVLAFFAAGQLDGAEAGPDPKAVDALLAEVVPGLFDQPAVDNAGRLIRFLVVAGAPFLLLLLAPALLPAAFPRVPRSAPAVLISRERAGPAMGRTMSVASNPFAYVLSLLTWLAGIALGVLVIYVMIGSVGTVSGWVPFPALDDLGANRRSLLQFSLVLVLFYAVLASKPFYERVVSPAFAICALFGLLATVYSVVAYIYPWSLPGAMTLIFAGAVLWFALINKGVYKLRFPKMDVYYPKGTSGLLPLRSRVEAIAIGGWPSVEAADGLRLIRDKDALDNWARTIGGGAKPKLAVVAVSGGALRSGLWVAIVLDRVEQHIPGFGRHVRIITGASGGMVGAGYYLLHRRKSSGEPDRPVAAGSYRPSEWVLSIPRDSLDPVARFIALRDPFLAFLPRIGSDDRGIRLENAWRGLGIPFRDLGGDEEAGRIPSMVLSPMMVEDGRRLLISNLDLGSIIGSAGAGITAEGLAGATNLYSLSALEFYRLFPAATGFQLNTGVRMNASFPYVSPSVSLPSDPTRRVFDGGTYDNYGIQVATAWMHKNFGWIRANTSGVVLVQIRDSISVDARLGVAELPARFLDRLGRGFRFFTSAPEAAQAARTSSAMFRNDEDIASLSDRFNAAGGDPSFCSTVIFENSAEVTYRLPAPSAWPGDEPVAANRAFGVPLNWNISRAERDSLIAAIPTPMPDGPWVDRDRRLERIALLRERVTSSSGPNRAEALTQLEQALNYERLVQLENWWNRPGLSASGRSPLASRGSEETARLEGVR